MQQKLRRQASGEAKDDAPAQSPVSDGEMRRRVKSVLNKLTPEKFNKLLAQMMECGACTPSHFDTIAQALFQEASMQHSFAGMYADLCACLVVNFGEGGCFLGNALLNQCWEQFRESLQPAPEASSDEDPEVAEEARAARRKRAIGNAKFMGELFVRDMLFAPELFTCTSMLLKPPLNTIALECLCTLLTVVGPFFDLPGWELHAQLMEVFWQIRGLTFDPSLSKRVKCLFRDVLDLRESGWVDNKTATKVDRPKRLEEVRAEWLLKEAAELKKQQELAKGQKKAARQHSGQWTPSTPGSWSSRSPAGSSNWSPLPSPMQTPKMTPKPSPKQSPKMSPTAATFKPMSPVATPKMMFAPGNQLPMAAMPAQAWNAEGGAMPMVAVPVVFVPMDC
jgi:translation initiation factor 4G